MASTPRCAPTQCWGRSSMSGSRIGTGTRESSWATENDFEATRQEKSNGRSCTCRHEQGAGRSVFRQQPGADARHRVGADLCRDDRGAGFKLRLTSVIPGRCEASNPESRDSPVRNCAPEVWCLRTIPGMTALKSRLGRYHATTLAQADIL